MTDDLETYISQHIDGEGELLARLTRDTHLHLLRPRMLSGHIQGRILKMICRMIKPRRILELGTFAGYSALCMAEALPEDGIIDTIEIDDELEEFSLKYFQDSPYASKIRLHIGDATEIIPTLEEPFDMVFIDADKRNYLEYYHLVFDKVKPGGFILADNTLWDGKVILPPDKCNDAQTQGILRFNDYITTDNRIEKVILPIRDGITVIYKK